MRNKFTDEELIELYNEGLNDREIAEKLGVGRSTVNTRRRRLGLEPNYHRERKWTRERVLEELRCLYDELERPPVSSDHPGLFRAICKYGYFDSYDDAREAARIPIVEYRSLRIPKETLDHLHDLLDGVSAKLDMGESLEVGAWALFNRYVKREGYRGKSLKALLGGPSTPRVAGTTTL